MARPSKNGSASPTPEYTAGVIDARSWLADRKKEKKDGTGESQWEIVMTNEEWIIEFFRDNYDVDIYPVKTTMGKQSTRVALSDKQVIPFLKLIGPHMLHKKKKSRAFKILQGQGAVPGFADPLEYAE